MKNFLGIIIIIGIAVGGFFIYQKYELTNTTISQLNNKLHKQEEQIAQKQGLEKNIKNLETTLREKEDTEKIYTIVAGGDIMMDRGVEGKIKKLGKDYNFPFDLIRNELQSADIAFANLEGSMSDVGADTEKEYSFRFEPAVAEALESAGIDIVSLANNHMLDWGRESLCETTKHLDAVSIDHVGAGCNSEQAEQPHIVQLGNTKIAFLAYTEFYKGAHATESRAGMSEWNIKKISDRISDIKNKDNVDIVMVSMHWGEEYKHRAITNQVELGKELINAGADVIIGHHPHVDQEIERYGNGWIIYSLGNFVFDQSWSQETMEGLLAEIKIQNKRIYDIVPKPIQLNENYQPYIVK